MFNRLFHVCFLAALIMAFTLPNSANAQKPVFKEVSVHDPSIIETNGTFYVFGSHLASAKTNDLMQWQQLTNSVSNDNPLIPNVYKELKEPSNGRNPILFGRLTSRSWRTANTTCTTTPAAATRLGPPWVLPSLTTSKGHTKTKASF